jgi:hypothetical protein
MTRTITDVPGAAVHHRHRRYRHRGRGSGTVRVARAPVIVCVQSVRVARTGVLEKVLGLGLAVEELPLVLNG